jgi:hypothetical protein
MVHMWLTKLVSVWWTFNEVLYKDRIHDFKFVLMYAYLYLERNEIGSWHLFAFMSVISSKNI